MRESLKVCWFSNYVYFVELKLEICEQETPLVTGLAVAAAAYAGRYSILAWQAFMARPAGMRKFYEGGFKAIMDKREAARILGVRYCHFFPSYIFQWIGYYWILFLVMLLTNCFPETCSCLLSWFWIVAMADQPLQLLRLKKHIGEWWLQTIQMLVVAITLLPKSMKQKICCLERPKVVEVHFEVVQHFFPLSKWFWHILSLKNQSCLLQKWNQTQYLQGEIILHQAINFVVTCAIKV